MTSLFLESTVFPLEIDFMNGEVAKIGIPEPEDPMVLASALPRILQKEMQDRGVTKCKARVAEEFRNSEQRWVIYDIAHLRREWHPKS